MSARNGQLDAEHRRTSNPPSLFGRLRATFSVLRPRTLTQLRKSTTDLRGEFAQLTGTLESLNRSITALAASTREQQAELAALRVREAQLRAIMTRNIELEGDVSTLEATLDREAVRSHVAAAVAKASLRLDPFPHLVVDDLLPAAFYESVITALPPCELFADRPVNKQSMLVPFHFAPTYSRRVWNFMSDVVVRDVITPALIERFAEPLATWVREQFPGAPIPALDGLVNSDGRIMLRTRGYRIRPHRDPKWGFLTCIFYLARRGDDERWGTDLYAVDQDEEAGVVTPYWIDEARCRLVRSVGFRRNRALVFLNSVGAHGAAIPQDAEPAHLERYIYQFRIGPDAATMAALSAALTTERRSIWEGKQRTH